MSTAFVLIRAVSGKEEEIIDNLKNSGFVSEVDRTSGSHNILATIENMDRDIIHQTVQKNIKVIDHVKTTITLIGTE